MKKQNEIRVIASWHNAARVGNRFLKRCKKQRKTALSITIGKLISSLRMLSNITRRPAPIKGNKKVKVKIEI